MTTLATKTQLSPEWIVRIAQSLAGLVDLRAAVTAMSDELSPLIPHDHIDVSLLTEDRASLVVYETGLETTWGTRLSPVDLSPIRDILSGRSEHMIFFDAVHDDRVQFRGADTGPIQKFGLRSRLHHKIEISGTIVGAVSVSSLQPNVYSSDHLVAINTVANVIGPYFHALRTSEVAQQRAVELERQKVLRIEAEHLVDVQERERERIGMDLHDHVLADMSRLLRNLDEVSLSRDQQVKDARKGLSIAIQDIRGIVEDARPTLLEMFGLGTAAEAYLMKATKDSSALGVMASPPEAADNLHGLVHRERLLVFRIIQEAVNNAVRHADANEISIAIEPSDETLAVHVKDNGVGFAVAHGTRQSGLTNMKARAAIIGAALDITSQGSGTELLLTLPLRSMDA